MGNSPTEQLLRTTIAALMQATGESRADLAHSIGLTRPQVSRRQSDQTAWTLADCDLLATHYGITVAQLLSGPTAALDAHTTASGAGVRTPATPQPRHDAPAPPPAPDPRPQPGPPAAAEALQPTGPCVLCGQAATDTVEGYFQHLHPADCAQPTSTPTATATSQPAMTSPAPTSPAPTSPAPEAAAVPQPTTATPPPAEAALTTPATAQQTPKPASTPVATAAATAPPATAGAPSPPPARTPPAPQSHREPTPAKRTGDVLPVDEIHQAVVDEATKAGGSTEAATAALVKRAIPDAMALWKLTRVGSRYDVLFRPPRPDILRRRSRNGTDDIWEARPKWRNTPLRKDSTGPAREVTVLDINGAYLAAMKTHLPHKQLEMEPDTSGIFDKTRSGVYLITPPAWNHDQLPNPLGNRDTPGQVWVTDATMRLLLRLSSPRYALCDPPRIHAAHTAAGSESLLEKLRQTLATARDEAIANSDTMTLEYVKAMYSKFISTCGESTYNREFERPEWMHIIHSQAFANLWWKAHKAHEAGLTVVAMAGTDELHLTGGDWRTVFDEGRSLNQVKVKDTYTLGTRSQD